MLWRAKNRWIVPKPKSRPCSARLCLISSIVASLSGPRASGTAFLWASIRAERRSPPRARGRAPPSSRSRLRQRLMLAALTSKRSAATRCDRPWETATSTRKSIDKAFDISAAAIRRIPVNQTNADLNRQSDSIRSGAALGEVGQVPDLSNPETPKAPRGGSFGSQLNLVAGAGFEPAAFRL